MSAKLPVSLLDVETLGYMTLGVVRFTTPWAMWVDSDMNCWLHPDYPAHKKAGGTVQMMVQLQRDGYHVWPPEGEMYRPCGSHPYASPDDTRWLPVAGVHQ